jgi:hypothetical protein
MVKHNHMRISPGNKDSATAQSPDMEDSGTFTEKASARSRHGIALQVRDEGRGAK